MLFRIHIIQIMLLYAQQKPNIYFLYNHEEKLISCMMKKSNYTSMASKNSYSSIVTSFAHLRLEFSTIHVHIVLFLRCQQKMNKMISW